SHSSSCRSWSAGVVSGRPWHPRADPLRASHMTPSGGDARPEPRATFPLPPQPASVEDPVELLLEEVTEEPEPQPLHVGRSLRGRCAIVTGGATGIGRAIALEFARQGAHVAFNYFAYDDSPELAEEAQQTAREIAQMEVRVHF